MAYDIGGRGDKSFNDSAARGPRQGQDRPRRHDVKELDAGTGEAERPKRTGSRQLADEGFNPIIAVGFAYADALKNVAAANPERQVRDRRRRLRRGLPNVAAPGLRRGAGLVPGRCRRRAEEQDHATSASSVASTVPLIQKFEAGYVAGRKAADAEHQDRRQVPHRRRRTSPASTTPDQGRGRRQGLVRRAAPTSSTTPPAAPVPASSTAAKAGRKCGHRRRLRPVPQATVADVKDVILTVDAQAGRRGRVRLRQGRRQRRAHRWRQGLRPRRSTVSATPPRVARSTTSTAARRRLQGADHRGQDQGSDQAVRPDATAQAH